LWLDLSQGCQIISHCQDFKSPVGAISVVEDAMMFLPFGSQGSCPAHPVLSTAWVKPSSYGICTSLTRAAYASSGEGGEGDEDVPCFWQSKGRRTWPEWRAGSLVCLADWLSLETVETVESTRSQKTSGVCRIDLREKGARGLRFACFCVHSHPEPT
jgi:hypothetical protein